MRTSEPRRLFGTLATFALAIAFGWDDIRFSWPFLAGCVLWFLCGYHPDMSIEADIEESAQAFGVDRPF